MLPEGKSAGRGARYIKRREYVLEAIVASQMNDTANPSHHDRPCSYLAYQAFEGRVRENYLQHKPKGPSVQD